MDVEKDRTERNNTMFRLLILVIALAGGYLIIQSIPDIQRYLRIRAM